MTHADMLAEMRLRIGSPGLDQVTNRTLESFLFGAADELAEELGYRVVTQANLFTLAVGVYEYPLPRDCNRLLWVRWNGKFLEAGDLRAWQRDGKNWRDAQNGNPSDFAVEGARLVLFSPPSSDALALDDGLDVSYLAAAERPSDPNSGALLTDSEDWCLLLAGARDFLSANPSPENSIRYQGCTSALSSRLAAAKRRRQDPMTQQHREIRWATRRTGAAR